MALWQQYGWWAYERDNFTADHGFCRFVWFFYAVSAEKKFMDDRILGWCILLGSVFTGISFYRTYFCIRADCFGISGDICGCTRIQKTCTDTVVLDTVGGTSDSGKYTVLHDERSSTGKYLRGIKIRQPNTSVCIVYSSRHLHCVDNLIDFTQNVCIGDKEIKERQIWLHC